MRNNRKFTRPSKGRNVEKIRGSKPRQQASKSTPGHSGLAWAKNVPIERDLTQTTKKKASNNVGSLHRVPWGRTLTTRDNFLGKQKTGSTKIRPVVVVDNEKDKLGVVPLTSRHGNNRTRLETYQDGRTYYKHFLEIEDNESKPIRVGEKFRQNHKNMDVSKRDIQSIRLKIFNEAKTRERNKKMQNKLHKK